MKLDLTDQPLSTLSELKRKTMGLKRSTALCLNSNPSESNDLAQNLLFSKTARKERLSF